MFLLRRRVVRALIWAMVALAASSAVGRDQSARHAMRPAASAVRPVAARAAPAAPTVQKVEPPNWWPRHSWNPVRLLIRGEHLHGARVESGAPGIEPANIRVSERGTYLFVDVRIATTVQPGAVPLQVVTPGGRAPVPFTIDTPLPREGRFQGFGPDDVIYLLMPDRFANGNPANDDPAKSRGIFDRARPRYYHGGDLQGVIEHLPYLKDLGVTTVWLNPVYDNADHPDYKEVINGEAATDYHGFHAIDFYAVDEHLGDVATLRALVDRAHVLGMKVIQDQVANHTCGFHPWVSDSPTATWFHGTEASHLSNTFQTHPLMDPRAPDSITRPTLEGWFVDILPDLNQDDDEVKRYIIQNSLWWLGATGLDGVRQDTLPYVRRSFWRDWMAALTREYPEVRVVGEVLDGSVPFVAFFQAGRPQFDGVDSGIDSLFDYPLFYGIRRAFAERKRIREAVDVLHHDPVYPSPERLVPLLGSHDVARFMNETGADTDGLKLATTFLMTVRGIPQWYYGDEIGMPGGQDPDNRRDFPGGWPGDARNAFEPTGRTAAEESVFQHTRTMMRLRSELEPLRRGRLIHLSIEEDFYAFARATDRDIVIVALNNASSPARVRVDVSPTAVPEGTTLVDRLGGGRVRVTASALQLALGARAAAVFVAEAR